MGINISTSMGFESREFQKETTKSILQKSGVEAEAAEDIVEKTIFEQSNYIDSSALYYTNTAAQIALNNSLRETLNYLRNQSGEKKRKYILGEIWDDFKSGQDENEENYQGELFDYEIDADLKNIFAA